MSGRRAMRYLAGVVLLLGACSGSDQSPSDAATDATATPTTEPDRPMDSSVITDATAPTNEADTGDTADHVATAATTTTTTTIPPAAVDVGRTVVQTTPTSGNIATPLLAWEPIDGAVLYTVIVADSDGSTWWTWEGAELDVVLGGVAGGPAALQTETGATWTVFAHSEDGRMLAASPRRPLDP